MPDTEDGIGAGAQVAPSAHHSNNFDFLRWLAASMVLTSHEFAVLRGGNGEPVARLTDGFATLGTLGVDAFFVISGYLVCASMMRGAGVPFFVAARALRLMPGLCVALLVSALVIGAAATTLPLADYWRAPETWSYIARGLALRNMQWTLPGVFGTLPLAGVVNGSLWSLWPEVQMYGVVALLALIAAAARLRRRTVVALGMSGVLAAAVSVHPDLAGQRLEAGTLARLSIFFALGGLAALFPWRARAGWTLCVLATGCALLARHSALFVPAFDLALTLGVLGLAHAPLGPLRNWGRFGDWSYGMYLYAFPVQQLVALHFPGIAFAAHFALAYAATLALGAASWHLVESPALALKTILRGRLGLAVPGAAQPRG